MLESWCHQCTVLFSSLEGAKSLSLIGKHCTVKPCDIHKTCLTLTRYLYMCCCWIRESIKMPPTYQSLFWRNRCDGCCTAMKAMLFAVRSTCVYCCVHHSRFNCLGLISGVKDFHRTTCSTKPTNFTARWPNFNPSLPLPGKLLWMIWCVKRGI